MFLVYGYTICVDQPFKKYNIFCNYTTLVLVDLVMPTKECNVMGLFLSGIYLSGTLKIIASKVWST